MFNTLRPSQNCRHFADDISKCIFLNENVWISLEISLKFVAKVLINNILTLVQIMAWRRPGDKPLSEPMIVGLLTHICVTRPQWVVKGCCLELTTKCYHGISGYCSMRNVKTLKRKGRQGDCPGRFWRRWRRASTSTVTTRAVPMTTFPFLWNICWTSNAGST